ncbi:DEP domain-containing protein 5, partial [Trachymyrmex septentrionalis]
SMKLFKLIVHQKNFSGEDLIINPKDYPGIKTGDVVEIYHPEDEFSRLLLQVTSFKEDLQGRETISVESNVASMFQLRTFADVYMNIVNPDDVALDSIELTFKDQYMGRSEMWRLKNSLVNTCVYINKKIEFCGGSIRCQVYEMWSQGDRVACGVITDDTKVVFRSSTSMVYLFLQMSTEMWDFDIHGDLYFEKAVNGFLADLFQKWKRNGSNHEVTIVLFSRTFYNATSLEEFPNYMRECLQHDYRGRFYEDFYRVAVQNERFEDWSNILVQLRKLFTDYQKIVLEYHQKPGINMPKAVNSTAAQGNFLEVLNMSLNVFEKHYLDRSFDRTGQLSVVITPGVGVFEVDRELTNVTKQRIIDNGVGSDLVCVGEQPLHAVPLLKSSINAPDDYSMPHWINLSFYSTNKKIPYSTFIPRIKLPQKISKHLTDNDKLHCKTRLLQEDPRECLHNTLFDYDAYDAQVFQLPTVHTSSVQRLNTRRKKTSVVCLETHNNGYLLKLLKRKMSDPDIHHPPPETHSPPILALRSVSKTPVKSDLTDSEISPPFRPVVGSAGSPTNSISQPTNILRPGRALINPFDPSHVTIKLTSNRRRWTHIFPKGPTGVLIQQHHYQAVPMQSHLESQSEAISSTISGSPMEAGANNSHQISRSESQTGFQDYTKGKSSRPNPPIVANGDKAANPSAMANKSLTLLWGATGEQEWTPALTTGEAIFIRCLCVMVMSSNVGEKRPGLLHNKDISRVDWKSLTIPACLPITTDYFPDKRSLQNDYVVSDYNLLPDDVNADFAQQRAIYKKPLTTVEVFKELVSQRLAQGFQLIILPSLNKNQSSAAGSNTVPAISTVMRGRQTESEPKEEYLLSIGRIFHKISLFDNSITVTRYRPRHPYPPFNIHYQYRFHAPHHDTYEVSRVSFTTEKLETYNWNYLDHYICTRGHTDFALVEALKYWRFRVFLLPYNNPATRKILEGSPRCDIYTTLSNAEQASLMDGFLRFIEGWLNKIRRPNPNKNWMRFGDLKINLIKKMELYDDFFTMLRSSTHGAVGSERSRNRISDRFGHVQASDRKRAVGKERRKSSPTALGGVPPRDPASHLTRRRHSTSLIFLTNQTLFNVERRILVIYTCSRYHQLDHGMIQDKLICHASGDFSQPFVLGFYLYHIVQDKENQKAADYSAPLGNLQSFENEWVEIEMRPSKGWCEPTSSTTVSTVSTIPSCDTIDESNVPSFLRDDIDLTESMDDRNWTVPLYKHTHLDIDINNKSDRIEWGHLRYQSIYKVDNSYELVVQWVASSGSIVADLIFVWQRKAQMCGIQMVPIPSDLLALPYTLKSDPLRGPIFIPLDTECLMTNKRHLFEEFREDTYAQRLFLFQEAILQRFGFMSCLVENTENDRQYVHITGNAFILVPFRQKRYPMGFLWSWNHMVSRKWKSLSLSAGDEFFQKKIIQDFRHFCSNGDNRLKEFWESCWELKEKTCTKAK